MDNAENQSSQVEEVALPSEEIQQDQQPVETQTEQTAEDADWIRNLRKDRKDALKRAEEAENRIKMQEELLQRVLTQQQVQQPVAVQEEDIISQIAQEEYVPGEKVAKALKRQQDQFRKELDEVKKTYSNQKQNNLFNDLKREFSDFDEIVNPETIAILDETNPRLANAIASSNDPYLIAVQTYEYIKAKGLASKLPSKRAAETDRKLEQNKKTVNSPVAFQKRPMAQAFSMDVLTDSQKKELQNEMTMYARQAGGY
jgi:hypothetical protein